MGDEIGALFDSLFLSAPGETDQIDARSFIRAQDLFWFWVLGAFEVVRTMSTGKNCFSERIAEQLKTLRTELALVRAPFAKQRFAGERTLSSFALSVVRFDRDPNSLVFRIKDVEVSGRKMIERFEEVVTGISLDDVKNRLT